MELVFMHEGLNSQAKSNPFLSPYYLAIAQFADFLGTIAWQVISVLHQ